MPIVLSPTLKAAINGAFESKKPITVAYVGVSGEPHMGYRGTVQSYGEHQLALWARDPVAGIAAALAVNPQLVFLYGNFDPTNRALLTIRGRGRIESGDGFRATVFDTSPVAERDRDPDRKGVAIIVDLESIDGMIAGERLSLRP